MSKIQNFWVEILSSYYTGKKTVSTLNILGKHEKNMTDKPRLRYLPGNSFYTNSKTP